MTWYYQTKSDLAHAVRSGHGPKPDERIRVGGVDVTFAMADLQEGVCSYVTDDGEELSVLLPDPVAADAPRERTLPTGSAARKELPIAEGVIFYFPAALAEVARVSKAGNDKHNPGEPLHHARGKSMDHDDCVIRHTIDAREATGPAKIRELAERAWRALAALQQECENQGAPLAPNARLPK